MKYFFIGAGGAGMSALAGYLTKKGEDVSGCDAVMSQAVESLRLMGANITTDPERIKSADIAVYSAAISEDDPFLAAARKYAAKVMRRDVLLGSVFNSFPCSVAVAGMHGKTTVSALVTHILSRAGLDPSAFIGGAMKPEGRNFLCGKGDYCVAEACEYKKSFLHLRPTVAVILNADLDHTDCYPDMESVYRAYNEFIGGSDENALIIAHESCNNFIKTDRKVVYFGENEGCDFRATDFAEKNGRFSFVAEKNGVKLCRITPSLFGKHNAINSLAAFATAYSLGIEPLVIASALGNFPGIVRRADVKFIGKKEIIEDYAHHPEQIKSLLEAVKSTGRKRLTVVFQPHTYSRTKSLADRFATCFDEAEEVVLLPVYAARENPLKGGTSRDLYEAIKAKNPGLTVYLAEYFHEAAGLIEALPDDRTILLVGAGDITNIEKFLSV